MKSLVRKRSVLIDGHRTSVSIEEAFWKSFKEIAGSQAVALSDLLTRINANRECANLSSAIRLFVLNVYREQIELRDEGGWRYSVRLMPLLPSTTKRAAII